MPLIDTVLSHSTLPILTSFVLGVMTMVSPCPFCSDVTAIAYLSKNISRRRAILWNGMWYVFGKCTSYLVLALVFILGAQVEGVRHFFEHYGEPFLGPFLIVVGVLIWWMGHREADHSHESETDPLSEHDEADLNAEHEHHEHLPHKLIRQLSGSDNPLMNSGLGAFVLGMIFALAFCPYSGLLYFGTLIPLTLMQPVSWSWLMPVCFGLGDALPVLIISLIISYPMHSMGKINGNLQKVEVWLRRACVVIFIGFGLYLTISIFSGHHAHESYDVPVSAVHSEG